MIRWSDVTLGASPLTGHIYIGKTKIDKDGMETWTDRSEDKTQIVLKTVLQWFANQNEGNSENAISVIMGGKEYKLTFTLTDVGVSE